ncbi:MAG TPA: MBL fold metallo-hydrolase [Aquabacterium sp.]|uniref:MBL fold metallo-hydrolase n=1 Tax=Aquabacterium sp. TaxID=1872578 RepID=UPI002DAB3709|nr:MBL fold metallo-hydrolase [Aquabacterium sp.]HET6786417.1 MBL fold metallo-hydrolase [Aquabacterium sp.]HEX5371627.1 MBL fold metallo-hydrolase [Aquabacterium sp.]
MAQELYKDAHHQCLMFTDLTRDVGEAVPSNQFLIVNKDTGAIIDPGGNMAYNELYLGVTRYFPPQRLAAIVASHADPDIIASLDRWMTSTTAPLYISKVWERFAPHFCKPGKTTDRVHGIPDQGMHIPIGDSTLIALPAHFLHAEGNFQFYDPISKILFSGDLGASFAATQVKGSVITSLKPHIPAMEAFHRRYMVSGKILRLWARMVRQLDIRMIVPQHGLPMAGPAVGEFIDWVQDLECGIDLMTQAQYTVPAL